MSFAAVIRPVIDRLHVAVRHGARDDVRALYAARDLRPGAEIDAYGALLDHPVPEEALAARLVYFGFDADAEESRGLMARSGGAWELTALGRAVVVEADAALSGVAERLWSFRPSPSLPGLAAVETALPLVERLLEAGRASGGPVFAALTPYWVAPDATAAARLAAALEALRHHRADAHRAAWADAGLTVEGIQALGAGPQRTAIEADTNRRDEPVYAVLDEAERWALLGALGSLNDAFTVT
ncbi:hypothetical protein [Glycomyces paridis]|uniref:Uncharacterized protein n=1 Tax=Glycomyces paridis TaxID=2126555 RepID=A0A4S8P7M3_9ACTN|nr:hypothetical protein [Glycomyces paridis]THV26230.1 hypothetical protein E9998_19230 [Glycomyces paridis]